MRRGTVSTTERRGLSCCDGLTHLGCPIPFLCVGNGIGWSGSYPFSRRSLSLFPKTSHCGRLGGSREGIGSSTLPCTTILRHGSPNTPMPDAFTPIERGRMRNENSFKNVKRPGGSSKCSNLIRRLVGENTIKH